MDPMRVLVVYYSRSGTTQNAAMAIREALGCELERIADRKRRSGLVGYLRSGFDATFHRPAALRPMNTDPNDYDLVIVGTPIWNASVSAPVRTYLATNRDSIRRVAFFCTHGGTGSARVLRQMEEVCAMKPVASLVLRTDEVRRGPMAAKVRTFVLAVKATATRAAAARDASLHMVPQGS